MKKFIVILLSLILLLASGCQSTNNKIIELETEAQKNYEKTGKVTSILDQNGDKILKISSDGEVIDYKADYIQNLEEIDTDDMVDFIYDENYYILQIKIIEDLEDNEEEEVEEISEPLIAETKTIYPSDDFNSEDLEIYDFFDLSMYDAGLDMIILYTDANLDQDGNFLFDDGNRFVLTAQRGPESFVLHDQRVQMASFNINVFTENDTLKVSLLDNGTAHLRFRVYEYDGEVFLENDLYESYGNVNMLGNFNL